MKSLLDNQAFILFSILTLGTLLGRIRILGASLGSIGVLVIALIFGSLGLRVGESVFQIGLLIFVYSVGLQAGPRFFRTVQASGWQLLVLGVVPIIVALGVTLLIEHFMVWSREVSVGIFSGALTNSSSLAAAIDSMSNSAARSATTLSYALVYPSSMLLTVLSMQYLPRLLNLPLANEEVRWEESNEKTLPQIVNLNFRVTNPNCHGKSLRELNVRQRNHLNVISITRNESNILASPEVLLNLGDILNVVTRDSDLEGLELLIGERVKTKLEVDRHLAVEDVEVTESKFIGKRLEELQIFSNYKVIITRIRRHGMTFIAEGKSTFEIGDQIRVNGLTSDVDKFVSLIGATRHTVDETSMIPFLGGLLISVILGSVTIPLPGNINIQLGLAGGAFITSVVIGYLGRIGKISLYVPQAAKNLCREFGLLLFLAAAGTLQGEDFLNTLITEGYYIMAGGVVVTISSIGTLFFLSRYIYSHNLLQTLGYGAGLHNNAPAIGVVRDQCNSDLAPIAYSAIFPISLIFKIVLTQLLLAL